MLCEFLDDECNLTFTADTSIDWSIV